MKQLYGLMAQAAFVVGNIKSRHMDHSDQMPSDEGAVLLLRA